ncbi:MAG: outer membrane beta-barrel protein [Bdellovibrionales bacterium]
MRRLWLLLFLIFVAPSAHAGFIELGLSANYRSSSYDKYNYVESLSYTGSFSYYFWEMCAWELNYTTGYSKQVSKGTAVTDVKTTIEDNIELITMDLVLSFAARQDPFRPYIKFGGGYLTKERFRQVEGFDKDRISEQSGVVPSAGVGLALNLTKEFSIKLGVEAWTSPLDEDQVVVDYAGRAGISWLF